MIFITWFKWYRVGKKILSSNYQELVMVWWSPKLVEMYMSWFELLRDLIVQMIEPKLVVHCTIPSTSTSQVHFKGPHEREQTWGKPKSFSISWKQEEWIGNFIFLRGVFFLAFPLILNGMENIYSVYPIHCNFLWGVYYKKLHNQYWNLLASYHTMYNQYWNMCV